MWGIRQQLEEEVNIYTSSIKTGLLKTGAKSIQG